MELPKKKSIPTLTEYAKPYLELHKGAKENTFVMKRRAVGVLVRYLGDHPPDKITPFIVEKYRIQRKRAIQALNSHVLTTGRNVNQAVGQ